MGGGRGTHADGELVAVTPRGRSSVSNQSLSVAKQVVAARWHAGIVT
jgi:hypothetical protein